MQAKAEQLRGKIHTELISKDEGIRIGSLDDDSMVSKGKSKIYGCGGGRYGGGYVEMLDIITIINIKGIVIELFLVNNTRQVCQQRLTKARTIY